MIDNISGPETLGIWDFAWSLVSCFSLLEGGVGSSVNRYIAVARAKGDLDGLNRIASSAAVIQRASGGVVLVLACLLAWSLPYFFIKTTPDLVSEARWLVFILGGSAGLAMLTAVYSGILTGCRQWTSHYSVHAGINILSVIGMFGVLSLGLGLTALAMVHLGTEFLGRMIRRHLVYRHCSGLKISFALSDWETMKSMIGFGGRMAVGRISRIILAQMSGVLIAAYLGPVSLALFARPRSLMRQASVFPEKYAFMLVPAVASLDGPRHTAEIRRFVITSSRTGVYLGLPIVVSLLVCGPDLVSLWMGDDYADAVLIRLIIAVYAFEACHSSLENLLLGLNLHGRPAMIMLLAAVAGVLAGWILLASGFGLHGVVLAFGMPWAVALGIYMPYYACRCLGIPFGEFMRTTWSGPIVFGVPFAAILIVSQLVFPKQPLQTLLCSAASGGIFVACYYWIRVLPAAVLPGTVGSSVVGRNPTAENVIAAPDQP